MSPVSPTLVYAIVGFFIGTIVGFVFIGSERANDVLIGAGLGLLIGIMLAFGRYRLWERK